MSKLRIPSVLLILALLFSLANVSSTFAAIPPISFGGGGANLGVLHTPQGVAIGDLDGDGKPDLAVADSAAAYVSVFRNINPGEPISAASFAPRMDFATGSGPRDVVIGDLNGDGKPELVVPNNGGFISVFRNTSTIGAISFDKVDLAANGVTYVMLGDLDGDGKLDLATTTSYPNVMSVFQNTGTGTGGAISFAAPVGFTAGAGNYGIAIGDLDGDGKPDVAVTDHASDTLSVFWNTNEGGPITATSFAAKVDFVVGGDPLDIEIGDLDGDGKPDLAVTNANANTVSVFRNTGTSGPITAASFAAKVDFTTGTGPQRFFAIGDLNGDNKLDLAVASSHFTVSVLRNTSTSGTITAASFAAKVDFATGASPIEVAIGDLNGDGKPEMVIPASGNAVVQVKQNNSPNTNEPPVANAGGPYAGNEGAAIALSGSSASDPDLDPLTYAWTVDSALCSFDSASALNPNLTCTDNGSFVATLTVDDGTDTASDTAAVTVSNVAPTATFGNDGPVDEGSDFTLSLTNPTDPGADTFTYAFDCGDGNGYGAASASNTATCPTTLPGVRSVKGKIIDDDGGETEYSASITVNDVPPFLDIPDDLTGNQGQTVEVPVNLTANGDQISAVAFTLGFDTQCLSLDLTDGNNDGLPDAVTLNQATGFQLGVNTGSAAQGSLGLVISTQANQLPLPTFSDGAVATLTFSIACGDASTALTLSNASFGNNQGASVSGQTEGGAVDINRPPVAVNDVSKTMPSQAVTIDVLANDADVDNDTLSVSNVGNPSNGTAAVQNGQIVYTPAQDFLGLDSFSYTVSDGGLNDTGLVQVAVGVRGDANGDVTVDAGDLPAVVLEIFDGDGNNWLDTLGGTFAGNPVGTDSNEDASITAGDLSCTVRLLLFGVNDPCAAVERSAAKASLSLPSNLSVQDGLAQVPIHYTANGNRAAALALALELDAAQVTFDSADSNGDGLVDGLQLNLDASFQAITVYKDGVLNLVIFSSELKALPDGILATLTVNAKSGTGNSPALRFSPSLPASLGGVDGASVRVEIDNDAVAGVNQPEQFRHIFLPTVGR